MVITKRNILWAIFFVSLLILFDNWQRSHGHPSMFFPSPVSTQAAADATPGAKSDQPGTVTPNSAALPGGTQAAVPSQKIEFQTDVFKGVIDTQGATLSKLSLLQVGDEKKDDYI